MKRLHGTFSVFAPSNKVFGITHSPSATEGVKTEKWRARQTPIACQKRKEDAFRLLTEQQRHCTREAQTR